MSWNYRVVREVFELSDGSPGETFSFREVYYGDEGEIQGWTEEFSAPVGESYLELKETLHRMIVACAQPMLTLEDEDLS